MRDSFEPGQRRPRRAAKTGQAKETVGDGSIHIVGICDGALWFESIRARQYNPAVIEGPSEPASVSFDDINQLLRSWSDGDEHALGELTPVVYAGLRRHALAHVDPRKVHVVEMRFFAGLSVEETAMVLKVSPVTVRRDWSSAKVWLYRELSGDTDDGLGSLETGR